MKKILSWSFYGCSGLTSVTLGNSITSIESAAFYGCYSLTSVAMPDSVTSIKNEAFRKCNSLTSVIIGKSIKTIGNQVFYGWKNLDTLVCKAIKVPETGYEVFKDAYINYATLMVPEEALQAYKAKAPWSEFGKIAAIESGQPIEKCAAPEIVFKDNTITFSCATEGATVDYTIKPSAGASGSVKLSEGADVTLQPKYTITCTAIADGYAQSDPVTKEIEIVSGDLDGDGKITITDLPQLIKKLMKK